MNNWFGFYFCVFLLVATLTASVVYDRKQREKLVVAEREWYTSVISEAMTKLAPTDEETEFAHWFRERHPIGAPMPKHVISAETMAVYIIKQYKQFLLETVQ